MKEIRLNLRERSYPILIGRDLLKSAGLLFKKHGLAGRTAVVVSQKQIASFYEASLRDAFAREGVESAFFIVPHAKSSEAAKSQLVWAKLIQKLGSLDGKNKQLMLVALGGGVMGDLTGFAASVYRRGIPYVQIPTTLTAQVDSAIGGKTGIDTPQGKNLLGTIYQPAMVLADTAVLQSLPDRQWSDGFAEVIKYGVIRDGALFAQLEKKGIDEVRRDPRVLEDVIARCAKIKASVVEQDEFDKKGVRIILNFGHTAGHGIEAAASYSRSYTHGEAVGIGMLVACDIAERMGALKEKELPQRLETTLMKFRLPLTHKGIEIPAILKAIGYDKKAEGGANRFILPVSIGKTEIRKDVPLDVIVEALKKRRG